MNFHSNDWIFAKLNEHYMYAQKFYDKKQIIGIFLRGSQNYGLDDENSDVDSMLLIVPTIEEICFGKKLTSTTLVMPNDEHIDVKDIKWMKEQILKQSPQFMECLMTPYFIVSERFAFQWMNFLSHKDNYFNYNKKKMLKAMRVYAHEKHHALTHEYPSRMHMIEKYGYDPKQLMHLVRYKELVKNFSSGIPFPDVLICSDPNIETYLRELKSGKFDLAAAQRIADQTLQTADEYARVFLEHEPDPSKAQCEITEGILDSDIADFVKYSLKLQFQEEN